MDNGYFSTAKRLLGLFSTSNPFVKHSLLTSWLWLTSLCAYAQLQASQWYFGQRAGLDFRGSVPVPLTDGMLETIEGCSSRADSLGNLLFYSDGTTVWNRQHQVMVGGAGLSGDASTTQYLIVAQPGSHSVYYLFSPSAYEQFTGFSYSVVDMRGQGGLGEVIRKNVPLHSSSTEKVTAIPHANGRDLWVIGHERDSDVCFAYLLTSQGIIGPPVLSLDGFVHTSVQVTGQLKASPNGRRLALALGTIDPQHKDGVPSIELLDFDPGTGRITNPVIIPPFRISSRGISSYGVEFSPDGTKLYVTDPSWGLYQFDLTAADVTSSAVQIPVPPPAPGEVYQYKEALQLAPDGRIYLANWSRILNNAFSSRALGVITEPNRRGAACMYVDQGVSLAGRQSTSGLPSFMQRDLWHFTVRGTCQNEALTFAFPAIYGADSVRWDFGDPGSGPHNQAHELAPAHVYRAPGRYLVSLTLYPPGGYPNTLRRYVDVLPLPVVHLGRDTALCPGNSVVLNPTTTGGTTYRWQDGTTAATLVARLPGWYWVAVTNTAGCMTRDSLRITMAPVPQVRLGADTVVCVGQELTLRPRRVEAGVQYRWQNGSTSAFLRVTQPGIYWVEGTNAAGCSQRDSVQVIYLTPPVIYLGNDTTLCQTPEKPFTLDATLPGVRYRWQDGSTSPTFQPAQSGTYWVTVSTPMCSATDTIRVRLFECQQQVFVPNIITPNGDGKNDRLEIIGIDEGNWALSIHNRWGQTVYTTNHYRQEWSPTGLANGVYYYQLRELLTGRQVKGWVEVLK